MIGRAAAFSVFRKWRDEEPPTRLRFDIELEVISLSLECSVLRVDEPLIGVKVATFGTVEFIFDNTWVFDFTALDAARLRLEQRIGRSPDNRRVELGEIVAATNLSTGTQAIFAEIVRDVDLDET